MSWSEASNWLNAKLKLSLFYKTISPELSGKLAWEYPPPKAVALVPAAWRGRPLLPIALT
jgi:hypothetical protein